MRRTDEGSVSIAAVGLAAVAVALACGVAFAGAGAVAHARAGGAADAAALAGATVARDERALGMPVSRWSESGCSAARDVSREWDVVLARCVVAENGSVLVEVSADAPFGRVSAASRAGAIDVESETVSGK